MEHRHTILTDDELSALRMLIEASVGYVDELGPMASAITKLIEAGTEVIVGPRYMLRDFRPSAGGSVVMEEGMGVDGAWQRAPRQPRRVPQPLAGPIGRRLVAGHYQAVCLSCLGSSTPYVRRNAPSLWTWAHSHRCPREAPE